MRPSPRAPASILTLVLIASAARASPAPVAATPQPPSGPTKIEWRDVFWGDHYGRLRHTEKPYQDGRLLEGPGLYLALRRPDLAEAYRKRQETKTGLGVMSGLSLLTAAIAVGIVNADQKNGGPAPTAPLVGLVLSVVLAGVFGIANACTPADVLTDDELHRLIDAHNQTP